MGAGDLDFTNVSDLSVGGLAADWHGDVAGLVDVISIYDVLYQGQRYLVGGYSSVGHDDPQYRPAPSNFIFNLDGGGFKAGVVSSPVHASLNQHSHVGEKHSMRTGGT